MPLPQVRSLSPEPSEPLLHDLSPIRCEGLLVPVRLAVRRAEDGVWRARLHFGDPASEAERVTAEIFCATTEPELWQAVRDLAEHHLRDLYRSLA